MTVLLRIAFRNIWQHKAKSFIIGTLIALGVIIIVIGNALMDAAAAGIRKSYIENFTGDLMIHGPSKEAISIFGIESFSLDAETKVPSIPEYEKIIAHLAEDPRITSFTSMAVSYGILSADMEEAENFDEGSENTIFGILFGIDAKTYFSMFPSIKILEGQVPERGSGGLLLSPQQLERLRKKYKKNITVGDRLVVTGYSSSGFKIRELTITGLFERNDRTGEAPFMYADIDVVRVLAGLTLGIDERIQLGNRETALLSTTSEEELFGDDNIVQQGSVQKSTFSLEQVQAILKDTTARDLANTADTGAWNFILIRLKNSEQAQPVIADYTQWFSTAGIEANITDWKGAAGSAGRFADILRMIFTIALIIVAVVAIIIMMNTLVISVIERTGEIGTMRALGAEKGFIRRLFLAETLTLSLLFGAIGSALALLITIILNLLHIPAANDFVYVLFGGDYLFLQPHISSFVSTLIMIFGIGYLAHLYPVSVALRIPPVAAMKDE
ncbi:MAG: FtsX-like permease family protein [Treponemataceae bacterium]|nr:FtsX-like permease family protein [Treponemataceae bacterium]